MICCFFYQRLSHVMLWKTLKTRFQNSKNWYDYLYHYELSGSTGMFSSTVCYCLSLSPLLFVCTICSRGQEGKWAYWNSLYPRGGHPGVLLPPQLLLQEDDRERALHHRGEQLPRREALHPLPRRLPAALRGHHGMQVREHYFLFWNITFDGTNFSKVADT